MAGDVIGTRSIQTPPIITNYDAGQRRCFDRTLAHFLSTNYKQYWIAGMTMTLFKILTQETMKSLVL